MLSIPFSAPINPVIPPYPFHRAGGALGNGFDVESLKKKEKITSNRLFWLLGKLIKNFQTVNQIILPRI